LRLFEGSDLSAQEWGRSGDWRGRGEGERAVGGKGREVGEDGGGGGNLWEERTAEIPRGGAWRVRLKQEEGKLGHQTGHQVERVRIPGDASRKNHLSRLQEKGDVLGRPERPTKEWVYMALLGNPQHVGEFFQVWKVTFARK